MSTLDPRPPYTKEELAALYPPQLELRQVQVLFRHGERTPVARRLQNAGVPNFWPFCHSASRFAAAVLENGGNWDALNFARRIETFDTTGGATVASSGKSADAICLQGELTDRGRETTLALGQRLRHLYVDQLRFLPATLPRAEEYYLRATPIVRALESLQQVFTGLYPAAFRNPTFRPVIHARNPQDEVLYPNEYNCSRFNQLARSFAALAAEKHNDSLEMKYLQEKIGKWMPEGQKVAVDGHPRLSGLTDTINSALAHGLRSSLPREFFDPRAREILNDITVDEWFRGYTQSSEYRRLGIGRLLGDIGDRAVSILNDRGPKLILMGCHDTTIASVLATLGCFDGKWPPFTSSIAVETFRLKDHREGLFTKLTRRKADGSWYVRLRYNDRPVAVKGCRGEGRHLEGDETFCTMSAFRETVAQLAPQDWKFECSQNLDKPGIPPVEPVQ